MLARSLARPWLCRRIDNSMIGTNIRSTEEAEKKNEYGIKQKKKEEKKKKERESVREKFYYHRLSVCSLARVHQERRRAARERERKKSKSHYGTQMYSINTGRIVFADWTSARCHAPIGNIASSTDRVSIEMNWGQAKIALLVTHTLDPIQVECSLAISRVDFFLFVDMTHQTIISTGRVCLLVRRRRRFLFLLRRVFVYLSCLRLDLLINSLE